MSKAVNSPTARLLQSSRLFSLPRPLPSPELSVVQASGGYKVSETATTPYPTHQAIVTTASSLHRGDWGLKRPLPGKKLRGTRPTVRIRAQDTWEHVTTFESAGDHVRTLQKWSEMGIPMMGKKPERTPDNQHPGPRRSVYDRGQDTTDRATARREGHPRWKYDGPWLSGMQEGEFQQWMLGEVDKRHSEWKEFLCDREVDRKIADARSKARDGGEEVSVADVDRMRPSLRPSDEEFAALQKRLRDDYTLQRLSSELADLIALFLDLPVALLSSKRTDAAERYKLAVQVQTFGSATGPPPTHPGAGLSHLRTNAIMENHPIHGPQAFRTPVQARVMRPRRSTNAPWTASVDNQAKVGVGGFVTSDAISGTMEAQDRSKFNTRQNESDPTLTLNPDSEHGGKIWVRTLHASVDSKGTVNLEIARADEEAVKVKTDDVESIHEIKRGTLGQSSEGAPPFPGAAAGEAKYGGALPDLRRMAPRYRVDARTRPDIRGYDDQLTGRRSAREEVQNTFEGEPRY